MSWFASISSLAAPLGLSGTLLVCAGMLLRDLPQAAWAWFLKATTMTLTIKDDDAAFVWVKEWLAEQAFVGRSRRVDLDTSLREDWALLPAPGSHWFWRGWRPFEISLWRSEETRSRYGRRSESLRFRTVGRNTAVLRAFAAEVAAAHERRRAAGTRLYVYDDGWESPAGYRPRGLESVMLPPGEKERLLRDLGRFLDSRERYRRLGVPHHRGYLFHGPPGTGKTSLASALGDHFGLALFNVDLGELNDRSLKAAVRAVPARSIILFEDIDAMRAGHSREDTPPDKRPTSGVSLAGLLNVLDGFHAPQEAVFVMTSNHSERLDAALVRPGRIDYRLWLGEALEEQRVALYRRFFPEAGESEARAFTRAHSGTMAEFQNALLRAEADGAGGEIR